MKKLKFSVNPCLFGAVIPASIVTAFVLSVPSESGFLESFLFGISVFIVFVLLLYPFMVGTGNPNLFLKR